MSNKLNGKDFVVGAVVGGVLGAVTALLFAPKKGSELRADISEQYGKISEKTGELADAVGTKTQEIAKTVGEQTGELVGKAKEVAGAVVQEVKSWRAKQEPSADVLEPVSVSALPYLEASISETPIIDSEEDEAIQ